MENIKIIKQPDPTITISSTEIKQLDINNLNIDETKEFSREEKKIIASRIEQIKNKKIHIKLFKIINDDDNNYTTNSNGIFLNLNNLHNKTLFKIEKLLDMYDSIKKTKINNNWIATNFNNKTEISDFKLTSQEKMFIKRQHTINNDEDIVYWGASNNV